MGNTNYLKTNKKQTLSKFSHVNSSQQSVDEFAEINIIKRTIELAAHAVEQSKVSPVNMPNLLLNEGVNPKLAKSIFNEYFNKLTSNELKREFDKQRRQSKMMLPQTNEPEIKPRRPTKMRGIVI